jgi:hypothetical protein
MRYVWAGLAALVFGACESPTAAPRQLTAEELKALTLQTDRLAYTAALVQGVGPYRTFGFRLVARFTNDLVRPVYLKRCYPDWPSPIYGISAADADQEAAYNPVWACVGHDRPIVVQPGETRTDTLEVRGPNAWDGYTNAPLGTLGGRFQLSYEVGTCRSVHDCPVAGRVRASNEFEVYLAP